MTVEVHRLYLTECENSTFRDLFKLPGTSQVDRWGVSRLDGADDDHPLVLHDSSEEFRALCWVLYAL
jgi:hypothetical protein